MYKQVLTQSIGIRLRTPNRARTAPRHRDPHVRAPDAPTVDGAARDFELKVEKESMASRSTSQAALYGVNIV